MSAAAAADAALPPSARSQRPRTVETSFAGAGLVDGGGGGGEEGREGEERGVGGGGARAYMGARGRPRGE